MDKAFKIGWKDSKGKRRYITVTEKADMLAEVADLTCISDSVSIRIISNLRLENKKEKEKNS